ncbi:hypothetical protein L6472_06070 [Prevotella sp. E13-17]|uniref:hypothetical protein n=1 Tax=Prevotella sp. E13-17 TaxID=2913616 RepID=UPI001ED9E3DF|nr:hypothetical protein [Prevotella sp. E13-17]UKK52144.1 hypothetical protein L6472_06070 [Prevotella sp. E13-17]
MFQSLSKGSKVFMLDLSDNGPVYSEGIVTDVSQPHVKDAQPGQFLQAIALGQQQEVVVDLVIGTSSGQRTFRNVPAQGVVDRGGSTVITESLELMDVEIQQLERISDEHIAKNPWHVKAKGEYVDIRKKISPKFAHEQERDETIENLKNQYGELKSQNENIQATQKEILDLLKKTSKV